MRQAALALLLVLPLVAAILWLATAASGPAGPEPGWAVGAFGATGRTPGRFVKPRAVACDGRSVVVIDFAGRVQRFGLDGAFEAGWSMPETEMGKPTGCDFGPDGLLYVADTHYHRVMVYDRDGRLVRSWGGAGPGPGEFGLPDDVAVARDGTVAVAEYLDQDRIQIFTAEGTFIRTFGRTGTGPGEFRRPAALAYGPDGLLYVADSGNHRIEVIDPGTGEVRRIFGAEGSDPGLLRYPMGIDVDAAGRVFVAEFAGNRVQMFDATGRYLAGSGGPGESLGCFHTPRAIALGPGGRLYVTDAYSDRVQILMVPGPEVQGGS